jgi:metal-responsive CopG/Arc/MetJ family transcriptional regulator
MAKISIELPDDLIQYMKEDPYVGDRSGFIAMLIRQWIRDKENSERKHHKDLKDPTVIWN